MLSYKSVVQNVHIRNHLGLQKQEDAKPRLTMTDEGRDASSSIQTAMAL